MRKKNIFVLTMFLLQFGCETPEGFPGVSDDIKDAKEKGVFIQEYIAYPNPYKINDTLQIKVKEAWVKDNGDIPLQKKVLYLKKKGFRLQLIHLKKV